MRIEFQQEGGFAAFPGLNRPFVLESEKLDADQTERLDALVSACNFFHHPAKAAVSRGAADYRRYVITIADGRHTHTAQFVDPVEDPHVQELIDFLNDMRRKPPETAQSTTKSTKNAKDV